MMKVEMDALAGKHPLTDDGGNGNDDDGNNDDDDGNDNDDDDDNTDKIWIQQQENIPPLPMDMACGVSS